MDNNEIMINEGSGLGTGMSMLIGAGLAFAVGGAVKVGKWAYGKVKAKREFRKYDDREESES